MTEGLVAGDGVALRVPTYADCGRWLELFHDPQELQYGMPSFVAVPASVEELHARVTDAADAFAGVRPGTLTIVGPEDPARFLGTIAWRFDVPAPLRVADLGYAVHPDARGRGLATAAVRTLVRWLTADEDGPRLARVQLDHSVENPASCRVALKADLPQEGVRRGFLPLRDPDAPDGSRRHDVCLHGRLVAG